MGEEVDVRVRGERHASGGAPGTGVAREVLVGVRVAEEAEVLKCGERGEVWEEGVSCGGGLAAEVDGEGKEGGGASARRGPANCGEDELTGVESEVGELEGLKVGERG